MSQAIGDENQKTDKIVADLLNQTKNELKHYSGDDHIEFDLFQDSIELLERAITNYQILTGVIHNEMISFWAAIDDIGKL